MGFCATEEAWQSDRLEAHLNSGCVSPALAKCYPSLAWQQRGAALQLQPLHTQTHAHAYTWTDSRNRIAKSDLGKLKRPWRESTPVVKEIACTPRKRDSGWEEGGATRLGSSGRKKKRTEEHWTWNCLILDSYSERKREGCGQDGCGLMQELWLDYRKTEDCWETHREENYI